MADRAVQLDAHALTVRKRHNLRDSGVDVSFDASGDSCRGQNLHRISNGMCWIDLETHVSKAILSVGLVQSNHKLIYADPQITSFGSPLYKFKTQDVSVVVKHRFIILHCEAEVPYLDRMYHSSLLLPIEIAAVWHAMRILL